MYFLPVVVFRAHSASEALKSAFRHTIGVSPSEGSLWVANRRLISDQIASVRGVHPVHTWYTPAVTS